MVHLLRRYWVPFPGFWMAECSCDWECRARGQDAIEEAIGEHISLGSPAIAWEASREHGGLQGVLLSDRAEQGSLW